MLTPKVLVLRTAGTNCDYETEYAFQLAGAETALIHINRLISGRTDLNGYHILAIPGGFSYGDDVAAGILLANEIKHKLGNVLKDFVDSGKLIIGICNGFQVLVPGWSTSGTQRANRTRSNFSLECLRKFECRWVYLETQETSCAFTHGLKRRIYLPIAHAEGRFTAPNQILDRLESNRQVAFRYVAPDGGTPLYPDNPNGSDLQIAGICDPTGRIFGMMPHPERFLTRLNHPHWTRENLPEKGDGFDIFQNAVAFVQQNFS